jgi:hypothetical protein
MSRSDGSASKTGKMKFESLIMIAVPLRNGWHDEICDGGARRV